MSYILTQLASDNFNRSNEEPLNPTNWTTIPANTDLAIVSHKCVSGIANNAVKKLFTGVSFPNNQYLSITIGAIVSIPVIAYNFFGEIRSSLGLTAGYLFSLLANGDGSASLNLSDEPNEDNYLTYVVASPKVGDVITIGAIGTTIFAPATTGSRFYHSPTLSMPLAKSGSDFIMTRLRPIRQFPRSWQVVSPIHPQQEFICLNQCQ